MGKLNIAHHKSYHPYRLDNIERVRRDEEEARLKEAKEDGRMALADAEARIALLREKAGVGKKKSKREKDEEIPKVNPAIAPPPALNLELSGANHINLFEDLEQQSMSSALTTSQRQINGQASKAQNEEKGVPFAPSEKDRNPWYTSAPQLLQEENSEPQPDDKNEPPHRDSERSRYKEVDRRARDISHKSFNDPLREVTSYLKRKEAMKKEQERQRDRMYRLPPPPPRHGHGSASTSASTSSSKPSGPTDSSTDQLSTRLSRESSERTRAQALIARKKREASGMDTPVSSIANSEMGYGDVFNRRETEDARKRWRNRDRGSW